MAIKGSLKEASLPDVLQLLAMGQKTGCLSVAHRSNFGSVYFDRGRICYAGIVNRRDRLGDILVKAGIVDRDALDQAAAQYNPPSGRFLLAFAGFVALRYKEHRQATSCHGRLLQWPTRRESTFRNGCRPIP